MPIRKHWRSSDLVELPQTSSAASHALTSALPPMGRAHLSAKFSDHRSPDHFCRRFSRGGFCREGFAGVLGASGDREAAALHSPLGTGNWFGCLCWFRPQTQESIARPAIRERGDARTVSRVCVIIRGPRAHARASSRRSPPGFSFSYILVLQTLMSFDIPQPQHLNRDSQFHI